MGPVRKQGAPPSPLHLISAHFELKHRNFDRLSRPFQTQCGSECLAHWICDTLGRSPLRLSDKSVKLYYLGGLEPVCNTAHTMPRKVATERVISASVLPSPTTKSSVCLCILRTLSNRHSICQHLTCLAIDMHLPEGRIFKGRRYVAIGHHFTQAMCCISICSDLRVFLPWRRLRGTTPCT